MTDRQPDSEQLSHVDNKGAASMVDVGSKEITIRQAIARSICHMRAETKQLIDRDEMKKGPVLQTARIAGIGAAKRTDELIPLCHQLPLDSLKIDFEWLDEKHLEIRCTARATSRTGVEMEALVGATTAALTVYDMCKAVDREMSIGQVELLHKTGGKSGDYQRDNK